MNHPIRNSHKKHAVIRLGSSGAGLGPSSLLQKIFAVALLGVMVCGLNVHLFVLQLYGWSGMMLDNEKSTDSWVAAAEQTLSGETPCEVCLHVETAISASDSSLSDLSLTSQLPFLSWLLVWAAELKPLLPFPPVSSIAGEVPLLAPVQPVFSPDAPPPRFV